MMMPNKDILNDLVEGHFSFLGYRHIEAQIKEEGKGEKYVL